MSKVLIRLILPIFLIWRVGITLAIFLGGVRLPFKSSFPYADTLLIPSGLPSWLWQWGNFDGVHYLTIAKIGYDGFGTQVFFPLYPALIAALNKLIGNSIVSGLIISNTCLILSALFLYKLVLEKFDEKTAKWSIIFLFAFPTSFFFGAIYPESLLLLLILLSFQNKGFLAGVFAGLASGTKLVGVFLAPVLIFFKPRNWWGILGFSGLIAFMFYLWQRFNSPLMFLSAQSAFNNNRASELTALVTPPQVIYRYLKIFFSANIHNFDFWLALIELLSFIFAIIMLGWLTKRKTLSAKILTFSWALLLLPTFSGTLSSMPRYLLPIFPLYVALAKIKNIWFKSLFLVTSVLLLAIFSIIFASGKFVS